MEYPKTGSVEVEKGDAYVLVTKAVVILPGLVNSPGFSNTVTGSMLFWFSTTPRSKDELFRHAVKLSGVSAASIYVFVTEIELGDFRLLPILSEQKKKPGTASLQTDDS